MSPGDLDLVMSNGLGLRYAFLGPLETMHLNAEGRPGGGRERSAPPGRSGSAAASRGRGRPWLFTGEGQGDGHVPAEVHRATPASSSV